MIERVEVIFGANAIQGLGATGSIINYLTRCPAPSTTSSMTPVWSSTIPQRRDDACVLPPGQRAVNAIYPLHAGKMPSTLYEIAALLGGLALALLVVGGVLAYMKSFRVGVAGTRRVEKAGLRRRARHTAE